MDSTTPELDLEQFLPYRFSRLAERISASLSQRYRKRYGISIAEWRVMAWVSQRDAMTAADICKRAYMDKATVSRAVQRLEERGLLRRTPSARDPRGLVLTPTPAGEALLSELLPRAHAWEAHLLETLTVQEYRDLLHVLGKLDRQLARMEAAAGPVDPGAAAAPDAPAVRHGP